MGLLKVASKRDCFYRFFFYRSEISKLVLKSLLSSSFFPFEDKVFFFKCFQKYTFKSSISYYNRSCLFTGFSRTVFHIFKLSRHKVKQFASDGFLIGMRKSSF